MTNQFGHHSQRLPSLDGLRAVSILMVLGSHATRTTGYPESLKPYSGCLWNGNLGVSVFFVISGFLITWLLLAEQGKTGAINLLAFYKRRVLRIFPVFYAFLLTVLLMSIWLHRDFSFAEWLSAATFTRNYFQGHWTLGHLWSISVEEQFYLLWPFALTLLRSRRQMLIVALCVIASAPFIRLFLYLSPWRWLGDTSIFSHADSLMAGCLLAIVSTTAAAEVMQSFLRYWRRSIQICGVVLIYMVWMLTQHALLGPLTVTIGPTLQALAITSIIASVVLVQEGSLFSLLNLRAIAAVGVVSYGLYIWQQIFLYPAEYPDGDLWWRAFPQNMIITFLVAWLSYLFIEKPFLKYKKKITKVI